MPIKDRPLRIKAVGEWRVGRKCPHCSALFGVDAQEHGCCPKCGERLEHQHWERVVMRTALVATGRWPWQESFKLQEFRKPIVE